MLHLYDLSCNGWLHEISREADMEGPMTMHLRHSTTPTTPFGIMQGSTECRTPSADVLCAVRFDHFILNANDRRLTLLFNLFAVRVGNLHT